MLVLSVGFLDRDNVVIVYEFSDTLFFLAFLRFSGRPLAVRRPLAFQVANDRVGVSLGRIRFVSILLSGVPCGGWRLEGILVGCASPLGVPCVGLPEES